MSDQISRLTAGEFLERIKNTEDGWLGTIPGIDGILLVTGKTGENECVYGPDPFGTDLSLAEYQAFVEEAMRITKMTAEERKLCEFWIDFP